MNEWKFVGQMDCDYCKFIITGCNYEGNCPYTAGWKDGQAKLLKYLDEADDLVELESRLLEVKRND